MTKEQMRKIAEETSDRLDIQVMRNSKGWADELYSKIHKCGVLPYRILENAKVEYYLFKPESKMPEKGDPGFQIAKGTREIKNPNTGQWEDFKSSKQLEKYGAHNLESLQVTALREGIEEIGLPVNSVKLAGEWGETNITSASTGESKAMWLYPLEMDNDCTFDEPDKEHGSTVAREWFNINNRSQADKIRSDHLQIIREVDKVIKTKYC